MGIKEDFDSALEDWKSNAKKHRMSSSLKSMDCDGFRQIIAIGKPALPFIRDELKTTALIGWGKLVKEILGDEIEFPQEIHGRADAIREHILAWMDSNLPTT
ncbi:MAG: hypothetical protein AAB836_01315 [Patescibacteria group bacterium]